MAVWQGSKYQLEIQKTQNAENYGGREGPIEIKVLLSKIKFSYTNESFIIENEFLISKKFCYQK